MHIRRNFHRLIFLPGVMFLGGMVGCASIPGKSMSGQEKQKSLASDKEAITALQAVAGSLSGKTLSDKDLKAISQNINRDQQTQSAIASVTGAISSTGLSVHYCPVDGERFSPRVKVCPKHQVSLKEVQED